MPSVTTPSQPRRLSTRLNLLARHVACIALALCPLGTAHAVERIVQAGTLIDGVGGAARQKVSIIIKDERIVAIEPGFVTHSGADIIDLKNATVLPGFIDCHVHIAGKLPSRTNATEERFTHSDLDRAFDATVFMREMLQQGFTSARDVGGGDDTVAVRRAIDAGKIAGPRLWVSLEPLGPTAGHGDPLSGLDSALSQARHKPPRRAMQRYLEN